MNRLARLFFLLALAMSVHMTAHAITLTLYVHEGSASGPLLSGVSVTGQDGAGAGFGQTTNASGYVTITGTPGTWQFTASKTGYQTNSWSQSITTTCERHAYLTVQGVTLTLYVHEGSASGPLLSGVSVTGQDGAGAGFGQTTNASGYVTIWGAPGWWQFTIQKAGYAAKSWGQTITASGIRHAYFDAQEPVLSVTPSSFDFGSALVGGAAVERIFTVRNAGIESLTVSVATSSPFGIASATPFTLASGASKSVKVRFTPGSTPGSYTRTVRFSASGILVLREVSGVTVPAAALGAIYGKVTLSGTGASVIGAKMITLLTGTTTPYGQPTYTDAAGDYRIPVAPGTYDLVVTPSNVEESVAFVEKKLTNLTVEASQELLANCTVQLKSTPHMEPDQVPIVLVRGRGPDEDWDAPGDKAERLYWEGARAYFRARHANVWECNEPEDGVTTNPVTGQAGHFIDGTLPIGTNAGMLRIYIRLKSQQYAAAHGGVAPDRIFIVAHSMGGLIARKMLTDMQQGPLDIPRVKKVVMLSTPNAGSLNADKAMAAYLASCSLATILFWPDDGWAHQALLDKLGPTTPATEDLKTRNFYASGSENFATLNPWPEGIDLYLLGGSFNADTVLHSSRGMDWVYAATALALGGFCPVQDAPNDGMVTLGSAQGEYFREDHWWSLSGTWVSCFKNATPKSFNNTHQNHGRIHNDTTTLDLIESMLLESVGGGAMATMPERGAFASSSASDNGPELRRVEDLDGALTPSEHREVTIPCDTLTTVTIAVITEGAPAILRTRTPEGTLIGPMGNQPAPGVLYVEVPWSDRPGGIAEYVISEPQIGEWTAILDAPSTSTAITSFTLTVTGYGNLDIFPEDGLRFGRKEGPVLFCRAFETSGGLVTTVSTATIHAVAVGPGATSYAADLYDDGAHADNLPNDGLFAAQLPTSTTAGIYAVSWRAEGIDPYTGAAFRRVKETEFVVSSGNAFIAGDLSHKSFDLDGDSAPDAITVECLVSAKSAVTCYLTGDLVDATGQVRISASQALTRKKNETAGATLRFHRYSIPYIGNFGPWHIENLALFQDKNGAIFWLDDYRGQYAVNVILKGMGQPPTSVSPSIWQRY